ncbi:MAG: hypothetical protein AB7O28_25525 [Vicinamibacterales bacterium]
MSAVALAAMLAAAPARAAQSPQAPVKACDLLPKSEIKTLIGANQYFEAVPPDDEAVPGGTSCTYAEVTVQVLTFSPALIDAARRRGGLQTLAGVGDEAYTWDNPAGYVEVYVKVGRRFVTVQRDVPVGRAAAAVRPGAIALAKALAARAR